MKITNHKSLLILTFILCGSLFFLSGCFERNKNEVKTNEISPTLSKNETKDCLPNWQCSDWSICSSDKKETRTCEDKNKCDTLENKPEESRECSQEKKVETKPLGPFEIKIIGDKSCLDKTNTALKLLKDKAEIHYDMVIKYVGVIECAEAGSGMYAWENPPRYQVGKSTYNTDSIWYAGTIAHDACHSKQYHDYLLEHSGETTVPENVWTGEAAELQCLDLQSDALQKIGADQATLDHLENSKKSKYWEVDYEDRWW
jgi:hypothetical protein